MLVILISVLILELAGNLLPSRVYSDATTSVAEFLWDALLLVRATTGMCPVYVTPVAF